MNIPQDTKTMIIFAIITLGGSLLTLLGVIYTAHRQSNKQQADADTAQKLLKQELDNYKEFLHTVNKGIKEDINRLSDRVDEHNNYGREIPVIKRDIELLSQRVEKLEDK